MSIGRGGPTRIANAQDGATTGEWVSAKFFAGLNSRFTLIGGGTWGGATAIVEIAIDSSGTLAQTITDGSFTADFSKVLEASRYAWIRVTTSGGTGTSIDVWALPHAIGH